jgi:hypothetical protein
MTPLVWLINASGINDGIKMELIHSPLNSGLTLAFHWYLSLNSSCYLSLLCDLALLAHVQCSLPHPFPTPLSDLCILIHPE